MAFQISLNSSISEIIREYYEPIVLNKSYVMGMKSFVSYNNIPNVSEKNNNNSFKIIDDEGSEFDIKIPTGCYEIHQLINYLIKHPMLNKSGTIISLLETTLQIKIVSKWKIDFTQENSIGVIFGFSPIIIEPFHCVYSNLPIDIGGVSTIKIKCNLVKCNVEDLKRHSNVIYDFPLDLKVGEKIVERPIVPSYYPINTDVITNLRLEIVDQNNKIIDFRGERIEITLDFKPQ